MNITLAQVQKLKWAHVSPQQHAIVDWHYAQACLAYEKYQSLLEAAERETKHSRYLRGVAHAETYLPDYQRHTILADGYLR